jgi:N4-gp56 family major capsid protein
MNYNDPYGNSASDIGSQPRQWLYVKKALVEAAKHRPFGQLANTIAMPKHMGKTIKQHHYLPILDDANYNDQGIDASGAVINQTITFHFIKPEVLDTGNGWVGFSVVGDGSTGANAIANAKAKAKPLIVQYGGTWTTDYATTRAALIAAGWRIIDDAVRTPTPQSGNLYGSSKDVGMISSKMPRLTEGGGRVNRVGVKRIEIEGTIHKYGIFDEYTQDSIDFDSDDQLEMHITDEMVKAANELQEDLLQIDLLNSAGIIYYGGSATSAGTVTGETGNASTLKYVDLLRLEVILDRNRCPKDTTVITGSRLIDTKTIQAARFMYIGSELVNTVRSLTDTFNQPAFIPAHRYAAGTTLAQGEIGAIGGFRFIVAQEMMNWSAAGATVSNNAGYRTSLDSQGTERYNVYPMLVVGDGAFTTISFNTDGKSNKFKIYHLKPGTAGAYSKIDPYGQTGFMSILFFYGFMALRPERIGLIKVVAPY